MSVHKNIREQLPEDTIVFDNYAYDNSIIGITTEDNAVYDFDLMVEELIKDEGFSYEDAVEWLEYNTLRVLPYCSEPRPIIMYKIEREDIE